MGVAGPESILADQLRISVIQGKNKGSLYAYVFGVCVFAFLFFLQVDHKASLPLSYICLDKTVTIGKLLIALSYHFTKKKKRTAYYSAQQMFYQKK